ncbi:ABC transporter permease [Enterococcus hulanensis]|uniref:ABC transporter permease n=1 Tax=Enterococcus hulanensis TaxID=2559929 RepID=A0ABU3EZX8_9ENTE|nr:ABC transporter permease [Enterococcus hulanensis]MDT2600434.1 ABC transporter permease [Enterococcus hulanensis]MDT2609828.1 ABC transporter permease [Enterococcus hulanensis]MDT2617544.1 ABC transporter permease [Enterococcus hulanensis]MDT2628769.1 ABC transporter permease [Enterococcus hulanensis]MDT2656109.1 ABC transporter permease [Enterococcus hulanensis]
MTTYRAILQILKKNKGSLLLGIIIMVVITMFYAGQLTQDAEELTGAKIAVLSEDDSAIEKSFVDYLGKQHTIVKMKDTSQKSLDDALYFDEVEYILEIPKDFSAKLSKGEAVKLASKTRPATFSQSLVDTTINNYLNTYLTYQKQLPELTQKELLKKTKTTLSKDGKVHFDSSYHKKKQQKVTGQTYNLLAYGMFLAIFSGYAAVNLAFNREEIQRRNSCSPVSRRKLSRKISTGNLAYAVFCWIIFLAFVLFITKGSFDQVLGYFVLNTVAFFAAIVSFSILITSILQNEDAISGINNIFIMGSCFVGGVFVPNEFLPNAVNKIAAFTPTYWFAQNNELIGKTVDFNQSFTDKFLFNSGVLLAFAAAFWVIHLITMRERGTWSLKKAKA